MKKMRPEKQKKVLALATLFDEFSRSCEPEIYEGITAENTELNIDDIANDIASGNIKYIKDFIDYEQKNKRLFGMRELEYQAECIMRKIVTFEDEYIRKNKRITS